MKDSPRKYINFVNVGIIPQPSKEYIETQKVEWNIAFDVMNRMGVSDEEILKKAKELWERTFKYSPDLSKWDKVKNQDWRKYSFISKFLPQVEVIKSRSGKMVIIQNIK